MNFKPLHDRIAVLPVPGEEKTTGGIIIPESAKEKPAEGIVVAVGAGAMVEGKLVPMTLKVNDKILFAKWGGTETKIEGKDYIIMKEDDVLAVYEN